MSIDPAQAASNVSRQIFAHEERAGRAVQASSQGQASFSLPELSVKHRQSAQPQADVAEAMQQEQERLTNDGLSEEPVMQANARQVQAQKRAQDAAVQSTPVAQMPQAQAPQQSSPSSQPAGQGAKQPSAQGEKLAASQPQEGMAQAPVANNTPSTSATQAAKLASAPVLQASGTQSAKIASTMPALSSAPAPTARSSSESVSRVGSAGLSAQGTSAEARIPAQFIGQASASQQGTGEDSSSRQQQGGSRQQTSSDAQQGQLRSAPASDTLSQQAQNPAGAERAAAFAVAAPAEQAQQPQGSQAPAQAEIVSGIMRQIERMREQGRTALQVNIRLPDGQEIKLTLRMTDTRVQVKLHADEDLHEDILSSWGSLSERAAGSGIQLDSPLFAESSETPASRAHALSQLA